MTGIPWFLLIGTAGMFFFMFVVRKSLIFELAKLARLMFLAKKAHGMDPSSAKACHHSDANILTRSIPQMFCGDSEFFERTPIGWMHGKINDVAGEP
jgi:hypothetical protein